VERFCECGNKPSDDVKCWEVLDGSTTGGLSSSARSQIVR
jgi:hypothetical protein